MGKPLPLLLLLAAALILLLRTITTLNLPQGAKSPQWRGVGDRKLLFECTIPPEQSWAFSVIWAQNTT